MSGKACSWSLNSEDHPVSVKNAIVLKFLGIAKTSIELRIQRLQWIKDIGASLADVNAIASDSPSLSTERYTEPPGSWVVVNAGAAAKGIKAVSMCSKLAGHIR